MSGIILPDGSGGSLPMDEATVSRMINSGHEPERMGGDAPKPPAHKRNPVIAVYAMNDYVVYERAAPDKYTGLKRTPVQRKDALVRMNHVMEGLFKDSCGKPQDEILYDHWLVEMTIKAAAKSAEMMGRPYRSRDVEAKLRQLEIAVKGIKDRGENV